MGTRNRAAPFSQHLFAIGNLCRRVSSITRASAIVEVEAGASREEASTLSGYDGVCSDRFQQSRIQVGKCIGDELSSRRKCIAVSHNDSGF